MSHAKILWGEGLFLRPQHFQQQDAYHEARQRELLFARNPSLTGSANSTSTVTRCAAWRTSPPADRRSPA